MSIVMQLQDVAESTRLLRIELQYWIICCLELKDCLVFTANVEFGCWSDFPISNEGHLRGHLQ